MFICNIKWNNIGKYVQFSFYCNIVHYFVLVRNIISVSEV